MFSIFYKENINLTEVSHVKPSRLRFSFLPPVSLEVVHCSFFLVGFSSFVPSTTLIPARIYSFKVGDENIITICEIYSNLTTKKPEWRHLRRFKFSNSVYHYFSFTIYSFLWLACLTLSGRRSLSYRNQSIDLLGKLVDWFLYDNGLRHERVYYTFIFKCSYDGSRNLSYFTC